MAKNVLRIGIPYGTCQCRNLGNTPIMKRESRWELTLSILLIASLMTIPTSAFGALASLPNPVTTPGAINPLVNQGNVSTTICRNGYTETIRPPVSYTNSLKKRQLNSFPYVSYGTTGLKFFEEDHLIPLELGGSPTSAQNLWPELWSGPSGARDKDRLENRLHALVCSGSLSLILAQEAISTNWEDAFQIFVVGISALPTSTSPTPSTPSVTPSPIPRSSIPAPPSVPAPPTPPATATAAGISAPTPPPGATGLCRDGTFSFAAHHKGMCSGHDGVAQFYS